MKKLTALLLTIIFYFNVNGLEQSLAQAPSHGPRVLVVMAHPDDESTFSVALYKIAKEQHGIVDLFVITNGEAGYKYSTLAETYYGVNLTVEKTGRANLPAIRKKELSNAGRILGVNQYYFANQLDAHYTLDEKEPLDTSWNTQAIKKQLNQVLLNNHYDFVFTLLPETTTHGQHKAATLIALGAIAALPIANRPIILGAATLNKIAPVAHFTQYAQYPLTKTVSDTALFSIDRNASFSYKNRINYKVIANWEIAEHKSQGLTQMSMNDGDLEEFWYFAINGEAGISKSKAFFNALANTPYVSKIYTERKPVYSKLNYMVSLSFTTGDLTAGNSCL
ncbi:PIG-L family deacetylase [Mucilaginibacter sp. FT3.2]|uniref:PIG-L family deacetylase n=1 Tax=Mucilaginibacter sp. FT3.2 TaxID=2723090 RepID=UPI00161EEF65|nr:PIG-L family deacetylase [Mucilaginibacter sp. FT3.2]MBB6232827.1 LmbE family N-acetylglucosaminyl deacetylase [Mucilaginibacter sp. FT3.2]